MPLAVGLLEFTVWQRLAIFLRRYSPPVPEDAVSHIVKGLGYFGDVPDDLGLPVARAVIAAHWQRRQPEILGNIDDLGGRWPSRPPRTQPLASN